jgi:hypothetical protein
LKIESIKSFNNSAQYNFASSSVFTKEVKEVRSAIERYLIYLA